MSILAGNDNPDFSKAVNASGNLVDSTFKASGGTNYVGPRVYVGGSPSLFLVGTATVGSGTTLAAQISFYASATAVVPLAAFPFAMGPGFNSLNLLIPVIAPYAQLQVVGTVASNAWNLAAYQSAVSTSIPQSVRRGALAASPGVSLPPGGTSFPFAFVAPGPCHVHAFLPANNISFNIADITNGDVVWSEPILPTGPANVDADLILPPNQCQISFGNSGGGAQTVSYTVTC